MIFINYNMYQHTLNRCMPYQCFWYSCFFDSFYILMIMIMITLMISMIILLMINMIVLYICAISLFSSHITCFSNGLVYCVMASFGMKRIMSVIRRSVLGKNAYRCHLCGKVYSTKKALHVHKRKYHTDDVCYVLFLYRV